MDIKTLTYSPIQVRKSINGFSMNLKNLISAHQILYSAVRNGQATRVNSYTGLQDSDIERQIQRGR